MLLALEENVRSYFGRMNIWKVVVLTYQNGRALHTSEGHRARGFQATRELTGKPTCRALWFE